MNTPSTLDPPPKRLPSGLLGMIALIITMELIVAGRHLDFTTVAADDWRRTGEAAQAKAQGRDVLCFGDSLVKYGVLPRVIEAKTGLKAFNLAINGGPMPAEYFLLRQALDAGAKPKAIVADFFPLMLPDQPSGSIRVYPEFLTIRDALDLAWTTRDGDLGVAILLGKVFPSIRTRFEIRAAIQGAFDGRRTSPWPRNRRVWSTWRDQFGAQPMAAAPGQPAADPALVAGLTPGHWTVDPINAAYFERFVTLAESQGVPVFWIIPPLGPEIEAARVALGTAAAYSEFAHEAQVRHPGLSVLDARAAGYTGPCHSDPIHLNEPGAVAMSQDIARAVDDHLTGRSLARWADLPTYAGRQIDPTSTAEVAGRPASSPR